MTRDELEKEAEQIHFALNHETLRDYDGAIIFLLSRLRAVHDAAIEQAARTSEVHILGECPDRCRCDEIADDIRALKIGDGK